MQSEKIAADKNLCNVQLCIKFWLRIVIFWRKKYFDFSVVSV